MREQCRHAELCDRGKHALARLQRDGTLRLLLEPASELCPDLVAHAIGYDHHGSLEVPQVSRGVAVVELSLQWYSRNMAFLGPIGLATSDPAAVYSRKEPVHIQVLDALRCLLRGIAQRVGNLLGTQLALVEGGAEAAVDGIHGIPAAHVALPCINGIGRVEALRMLAVEALGLRCVGKQVKEARNALVPFEVLAPLADGKSLCTAVGSLRQAAQQGGQDNLVYAWENVRIRKSRDFRTRKHVGKVRLLFDPAAYLVEDAAGILPVKPIAYDVEAEARMRPGDPIGVAGHHVLWQRAERSREQQVLRKSNLGHRVPGIAQALLQQGGKCREGIVFLEIGEELLAATFVQSAQQTFNDILHAGRLRL